MNILRQLYQKPKPIEYAFYNNFASRVPPMLKNLHQNSSYFKHLFISIPTNNRYSLTRGQCCGVWYLGSKCSVIKFYYTAKNVFKLNYLNLIANTKKKKILFLCSGKGIQNIKIVFLSTYTRKYSITMLNVYQMFYKGFELLYF